MAFEFVRAIEYLERQISVPLDGQIREPFDDERVVHVDAIEAFTAAIQSEIWEHVTHNTQNDHDARSIDVIASQLLEDRVPVACTGSVPLKQIFGKTWTKTLWSDTPLQRSIVDRKLMADGTEQFAAPQ